MKKIGIIIFSGIVLLSGSSLSAQNKKELQAENSALRTKLRSTEASLSECKREENTNLAKVAAVEAELVEVRATNATLMNNLNQMMEASSKKTENIGKSLENIQRTERQLRLINDALTTTDSTVVAMITSFKKSLGEDVKVNLSNGVVAIVIEDAFLFGEKDASYSLDVNAMDLLGKIATVLKRYPDRDIIVESKSNALDFSGTSLTDNWDLSGMRASAVVRVFKDSYQIDPKRLQAIGKEASGFDSIETKTQIKIQPGFDKFYLAVKEAIKNNSGN